MKIWVTCTRKDKEIIKSLLGTRNADAFSLWFWNNGFVVGSTYASSMLLIAGVNFEQPVKVDVARKLPTYKHVGEIVVAVKEDLSPFEFADSRVWRGIKCQFFHLPD